MPIILVVDDSAVDRQLIGSLLERDLDWLVEFADSGEDALQVMQTATPDVVITDINMPNLDGFGVIEELRGTDINSKVPILVLTTESAPEMKARARNAGATGWITKPFDDASLIFALKRVTGAAA